jgi:hypothetical protein
MRDLVLTMRQRPKRSLGRRAVQLLALPRLWSGACGRAQDVQEWDLSEEVLVALSLDGKSFAQATMVVALRQGRCLEEVEPALSAA